MMSVIERACKENGLSIDVYKRQVMGRACRNTANIKNRQPIGKMFVKAPFELSEFYKEIIADELNVKEVVFTDDVREFTSYSFKPQLKTVGPKYGKFLGGIKETLSKLDGNKAMDEDVYKRQECKQRNYNMTKEKKNHPERLETKKYCKFCKTHTLHKETK